MEFIISHLPPSPARVLDAGCGDGRLAERLREAGYDVIAIDIDPAYASPAVRVADICDYDDEPFDAVIFSLSLHHVHDLTKAVNRASVLLKPGGRLIVDEFAYERADAAIADRFHGEAGSLPRWRAHHREFHTGAAMVEAIAGRFAVDSLSHVPYLHRYLEDASLRDVESVLGLQLIAERRETVMAIVRTTRYGIDPADLEEALTRRTAVIDRIRAELPGLTHTRLTRLEDGTYADAWLWASEEELQAALAAAPNIPEAGAAFAITKDPTADNAEVVDER